MKMPQEFAGKRELEDGFKMGFEDAFHNLYTDGNKSSILILMLTIRKGI